MREAVLSHGVEAEAGGAFRAQTESWIHYELYDLASTRSELHRLQRGGWCGSHWSVSAAVTMRLGAFDTARMLATRGALPDRFRWECPFCADGRPRGEDLPHLIVECERWQSQRHHWLVPVWEAAGVADWLDDSGRALDLTYIVLGGAVGARICGPSVARGVQSHLRSWLVSLAGFVGAIQPLRNKELRRIAKSQSRLPAGRTGPRGQGAHGVARRA